MVQISEWTDRIYQNTPQGIFRYMIMSIAGRQCLSVMKPYFRAHYYQRGFWTEDAYSEVQFSGHCYLESLGKSGKDLSFFVWYRLKKPLESAQYNPVTFFK